MTNGSKKLIWVVIILAVLGVGYYAMANRTETADNTVDATIENSANEAEAVDTAMASAEEPHTEAAVTLNKTDVTKEMPDDIIMGDAAAPVTIIEYASLTCPHCAAFHNDVLPKLVDEYITPGKAKLIARPFPLNEPALRAAMVSMCVDKSRYYTYLRVMFMQQERWAFVADWKTALANIAAVGGMSKEEFEACLQNKEVEDKVLLSRKLAGEQLKLASTPSFLVNGKLLKSHTIEDMRTAINAALAEQKSSD